MAILSETWVGRKKMCLSKLWIKPGKIISILGSGIEMQDFYEMGLSLTGRTSSGTVSVTLRDTQLHKRPARFALPGTPFWSLPHCSFLGYLLLALWDPAWAVLSLVKQPFSTAPQPRATEEALLNWAARCFPDYSACPLPTVFLTSELFAVRDVCFYNLSTNKKAGSK